MKNGRVWQIPSNMNQNLGRTDLEMHWCYTQLTISNRTQKKSIWNRQIQTSENQDKDEKCSSSFLCYPPYIYSCLCVFICMYFHSLFQNSSQCLYFLTALKVQSVYAYLLQMVSPFQNSSQYLYFSFSSSNSVYVYLLILSLSISLCVSPYQMVFSLL